VVNEKFHHTIFTAAARDVFTEQLFRLQKEV
jgi:hypothetical protein